MVKKKAHSQAVSREVSPKYRKSDENNVIKKFAFATRPGSKKLN